MLLRGKKQASEATCKAQNPPGPPSQGVSGVAGVWGPEGPSTHEPSCLYQLVTGRGQIQIKTQYEKREEKRTENTGSS